MDEQLERANARARRHAAELRLALSIQALVTHELGNPLQSLVVLVELTRDELEARSPTDAGVARLDRALESVERFRSVLVNSGRVRRAVFELDDDELPRRRWGATLDDLLFVVAHRLARVEFERETGVIDDCTIAPALPSGVVLAALIGVCDQLRRIPSEGVRVVLDGEVLAARVYLNLRVTRADGELDIDPSLATWLEDLLAEAPCCDVDLSGGTLTLSSPLA